MMALEVPVLSALMARMDEPRYSLAAFGVAFAARVVVEAPVVMLMAAAVRLVRNRQTYRRLRRFAFLMTTGVTINFLILQIPGFFELWTIGWLNLDPELARLSGDTMLAVTVFPAAIGYRRFYQGILILENRGKEVAGGTVIRLLVMLALGLVFFVFPILPGAVAAGVALTGGAIAEAAFVRLRCRHLVRRLRKNLDERGKPLPDAEPLTWPGMARFYLPLAMTGMLSVMMSPAITFALSHTDDALDSLAVLPVVNAVGFIFRAMPLAYQEVIIALMGSRSEGYFALRRYAMGMGTVLTLLLALLALTPLSGFWYQNISGLSPALAELARIPTIVLIFLPGVSLILCWQKSVLIHLQRTGPVTIASALEIAVVILVLVAGLYWWPIQGVIVAIAAQVIARSLVNLYLAPPTAYRNFPPGCADLVQTNHRTR